MSRNIGTVDGGKDLKEKRTGAKDRGRKGSWRTVRGKNKKDWLHHIAWVWPSSRWLADCIRTYWPFPVPTLSFPSLVLWLSKSVLKPLGVARQGMCVCKGASLPGESEPKVERRISLGIGWEGDSLFHGFKLERDVEDQGKGWFCTDLGGHFCGGKIIYMHWHSSARQIGKNAESHVCHFWKREFPVWKGSKLEQILRNSTGIQGLHANFLYLIGVHMWLDWYITIDVCLCVCVCDCVHTYIPKLLETATFQWQ